MDKIIEWVRYNWHEPGIFCGVQDIKTVEHFPPLHAGVAKAVICSALLFPTNLSIGHDVHVGTQRNSIHIAVISATTLSMWSGQRILRHPVC